MTKGVKGSEEVIADCVYHNARIYTVDRDFSVASALAIRGDGFIFVGSDDDARKHIGDNTLVIDLHGKTVLPGLIDSHLHFLGIGLSLLHLDVFLKPKQAILDDVADAYESRGPGEWIRGRGWSQAKWDPPVFPTKEDLDAVAPDTPVVLYRVCGHAAWLNSKALEIAGITANTPDPPGGEIIRDDHGQPTGVLIDTAMDSVWKHSPGPTDKEIVEALLSAQHHLLSFGLTGARDADLGPNLRTISHMKALYESGDLKVRIYQMCSPDDAAEHFYAVPAGERVGLFGNRYSMRSVKLMADGSLGGGSAWLLHEYHDRPRHSGNPRYTDEEVYGLVKEARKAGFQVNTHAIGDAATRQVLDAYDRVLTEMPDPDHRYCIEHAEVVALEDIPRFAALGVLPSMQAVFTTSDWSMVEARLGSRSERIKGVNAFRKFIESGCIVPNGTDSPVEMVNPYHSLYAAVTRMDRDGQPPGGWYPEQCMTRQEALRSHTIWAAYAQFEEDIKGSIEAGKLADFVVIDRDYMTCPAEQIKDIQALITVLGGETLYTREYGGSGETVPHGVTESPGSAAHTT
ncbi:MAG: amidohydrolase [Dehalococcoidia bacterium]|nr:amidohydrolase [Dehalococcoidia bacterium]